MSETARKITMKDGRVVEFGEKQKLDKSYGKTAAGLIFCQIDFENGETIRVEVDPKSEVGLQALGHGLSQKLGDAASGAESIGDAFEAILEVASRISKGEWTKQRGDGGSAKGASELVEALVIVLGKDKDYIRNVLAELKQADKLALRKTPEVQAAIEKIRAARAPSKAEQDKVAAGASLLGALKGGAPLPKAPESAPNQAPVTGDPVEAKPKPAAKAKA